MQSTYILYYFRYLTCIIFVIGAQKCCCGRSFGVNRVLKKGTIAWRCTCRLGKDWCRATVAQKGDDFIFGKNPHNCKIEFDKSLHAEIMQEVKHDVKN